MVAIFELAAGAARQGVAAQGVLADQMEQAAQILRSQTEDDTAQVYALGLLAFARRFRSGSVTLDELVRYVRQTASEKPPQEAGSPAPAAEPQAVSGEVLKALVNGLADWNQMASAPPRESGEPLSEDELRGPGMGYLFELGMAYMQAKKNQKGRVETLAETAVLSSPLAEPAYRARSGKLAITAFLMAMLG